jgi:hypothetical protein
MLEKILSHEKDLFFLINHAHTCFFDRFMWSVSDTVIRIPLFVPFLFALIHGKIWKECYLY